MKDPTIYTNRGLGYEQKGEHDKAIADYNEAIRLDPRNLEARYERAAAYDNKGEHDKAIAEFTATMQLDPKYSPAVSGRGFAYLNKSDVDKAIADFNSALRLDGNNSQAFFGRGAALAGKGDDGKAIADFNEALRIDAKNHYAFINCAASYARKGEFDKAIADCSEAIRLDPKAADAYYRRGHLYSTIAQNDKAIADFTEAIRLNPKDDLAYGHRGWNYMQKGQLKLALADLDAAVKISPKSLLNLELRAALRIRRGDYDGGMADLKAAVAIDPKDPAARFESLPKRPLTATEIEQGKEQVRQMLRDRPAMAEYGEKAAVLRDWASRKFAGEDLRRGIIWDASEPLEADSNHHPPTNEQVGRIRIRRTRCDDPNKGKAQTFEEMWEEAVFELYNITSAEDFIRLDREGLAGHLTKDAYVTGVVDCESRAAEKTRAFYIHVFAPWAAKHGVASDPKLWYVGVRVDCKENLTLLQH